MSTPNTSSTIQTPFTTLVGIEHPIVQAPMAGGHTTPDLVAAVSNAGALGGFGAAVLAPDAIREGIQAIRARTDKPFLVNLFVLNEIHADPDVIARAQDRLTLARLALSLPTPETPTRFFEDNRAQIDAALQEAPPAVSFTFGIPSADTISAFKKAGSIVIGTITNVEEAKAWARAGADALCVQGIEAGGHRGTIPEIAPSQDIPLLKLLNDVSAAVSLPLIAAGGLMDGHDLRTVLDRGAHAAQLGTAFLCCDESGTPEHWKQALQNAQPDKTHITRAFSGRPARALLTRFALDLNTTPEDIAPYPIQNTLTRDIRRAAVQQKNSNYFSYWAGQNVHRVRPMPVAQLIDTLLREAEKNTAAQ